MEAKAFRAWRKEMGLKQRDAAEKLGLKKRVIQYYEKGDRDGRAVEIPKAVELACLALALGFESYDGAPRRRKSPAPTPPKPNPLMTNGD
ncbi:hypothetical protein GCM10011390_09680 [Aureimonas endophytica]|uniref:HTH cro/C1-type domain-containing protein n=1 Tax=Aureimonas endophytica TaxID=2027858 RepID=A0A917E2F3_9HYPH|nr:helix-turn-helix transcriptional regulator [Aureimonas endophytica]GGD93006.1 hypothetical protein GCM10011390_09680 [Aureimonas endophytica]